MPKGRMLNKVISTSEKLSKVSIHSALLYTWMIPHLDIGGKIFGNSEQIKGIVVPYRKEFTIKKIKFCLKELSEIGLILVYGAGCKYILLNGFDTHQTLNESREAPSNIPNPSPEFIQSLSDKTPGEVKLSLNISLSKEKEEVLSHWNTFAKDNGLSTILLLSEKRMRGISARLKETQFDLHKIFKQIEISDFLKGKNERGWKVDFDFVFCSANNYLKIMEGKYANNKGSVSKPNYVSPEEITDGLNQAFSKSRAAT